MKSFFSRFALILLLSPFGALSAHASLKSILCDSFLTMDPAFLQTDPHTAKYFSEEEKLQYLVRIQDGLFYDAKGDRLETPDHLDDYFVIDPDGQIYVYNFIPNQGAEPRHSSATSGGPVLFAGNARFVNGQLVSIDNNSGHYKPTANNVVAALLFLDSKKTDLSVAKVYVRGEFDGPFVEAEFQDYAYRFIGTHLDGFQPLVSTKVLTNADLMGFFSKTGADIARAFKEIFKKP